jgi:hypothetical protein
MIGEHPDEGALSKIANFVIFDPIANGEESSLLLRSVAEIRCLDPKLCL